MHTLFALGPWNWMILAAILFVLEVTAPGIFFMWFGLAAIAMFVAFRKYAPRLPGVLIGVAVLTAVSASERGLRCRGREPVMVEGREPATRERASRRGGAPSRRDTAPV